MKRLIAGFALASLAACSSGGDFESEETPPQPADRIELKRDVDPGPGPWDQPEGQMSGAIDWLDISTEEGMTFLGGALVVDKIRRHYSENVLGVDVRLRNTTSDRVEGLYFVEFRSATHEPIMGHKKEWHSFIADAHDYVVLTNSALTTGAVGFRLFVRGKSLENQGAPDPKKE